MNNNSKNIIVTIFVLIVTFAIGYFLISRPRPIPAEIKTDATNGWETFTDDANQLTFQYPENIPTTYIHTIDWPPAVQVLTPPFSCTDAGEETARAGETKKETINGRTYCVTKVSEGAAGSTYTQYAYERELLGKILYFTFTLQSVQCANYDEPKKTACDQERAYFNIDPLIDQIVQTTKFTP